MRVVQLRRSVLVSPPALEPLTIDEVKLHVRVTQTAEDALIDRQIQAARERVEAFTHRALLAQTWTALFDTFPDAGSALLIPRPPLAAVVSVTYVDPVGVVQTWPANQYVVTGAADAAAGAFVDPHAQAGAVWPAGGGGYPAIAAVPEAVRVTFRCGYGTDRLAVPAMLTRAMAIAVADLFGDGRASRSPRDVEYDERAIANQLGPFVVFEPWASEPRTGSAAWGAPYETVWP